MAAKAESLVGIEVDAKVAERAYRVFQGHPRIKKVLHYDGQRFPFSDKTFDVVTCVEVLEHVDNYKGLLLEMARVSKRLIFITTPNRRPENTHSDGRPRNYWHLREWTKAELEAIFGEIGLKCEWHFLNGSFEGPFTWTEYLTEDAWSLVPAIILE